MAQAARHSDSTESHSHRSGLLRRFLRRFGVIVSVVGALHFYVANRMLAASFLAAPVVAFGWVLFTAAFVSLPLGMMAMMFPKLRIAKRARGFGMFWLGAFFVLLSLTAVTDLARAIGLSWLPLANWRDWQSTIIGCAGPMLIALAAGNARRDPRVVRRKVKLPGIGEGMRGFRIVQISDLHVGHPGTDKAFLERLVKKIEALNPDAIAITGDAVEESPAALADEISPLGKLYARNGVYYVTGNHEYYHDGPAWERRFAQLGFTVLDNQHRVVERNGSRIAIGGVPDTTAVYFDPSRESSPEKAFATAPPSQDVPRILLAHQPKMVTEAAKAKVAYQLSGHTHGGQIFPFNLFVRLQQPMANGLKRFGNVLVYANPGTGYWGPRLRLGTRAEITEHILDNA